MRKKLKLRDVIKNKSKEAKEYSKQYDKAMKMQETADIKWKEAKELYKATGKNAVSRFLNNMKYDLGKKQQRPFDEHLGSPMERAKKDNGRIGRAPTLEEIRKKNHSYNI